MADRQLGGVSVTVKGDLSQWETAQARARQQAVALDADLTGAAKNIESATRAMGATGVQTSAQLVTAQQALINAYQTTGRATADMIRAVGGYEAAEKLLAQQVNGTTAAVRNQTTEVARAAAGLDGYAKAGNASAAAFQGGAASAAQLSRQTHDLRAAQSGVAAAMFQTAGQTSRTAEQTAKLGQAQRLTRQEGLNLYYQLNDLVVGLTSGQRPMTVLIQQGSQIGQVFAAREGAASGALALFGSILKPLPIGLGLVAVAAGVTIKALIDLIAAQDKFSQSAQGLGRFTGLTGKELERLAEQSARTGDITVKSSREITAAFLQVSTIGADMNAKLTTTTRDFAAAMGLSSKEAAKALAQSFGDPEKGAQTLNQALGILTASEQRHIEALAMAGRYGEAQLLLYNKLRGAVRGAADNQNYLSRQLHEVGVQFSQASTEAAKFLQVAANIASMALSLDSGHVSGGAAPAPSQTAAQAAAARRSAELSRASALAAQTAYGILPDPNVRRQLDVDEQRLRAGLDAAKVQGDTQAQKDYADALDRVVEARKSYIDQGPRAHDAAQADLRSIEAIGPAARAAAAGEQERLRLSGEKVGAAEREQRIADAERVAYAQAAQSLTIQNRVLAANTNATLELADSELQGAAAAQRAEATRKAVTEAVASGADALGLARRHLAAAVAEEAAAGGKQVMSLRQQADVQKYANDAVAAGLLPSSEAQRQVQLAITLAPLDAAATNASAEAKETLRRVIDGLIKAYGDLNREQERQQLLAETQGAKDETTMLREESKLINATNRERAVALAQLETELDLKRRNIPLDSPDAVSRLKAARDRAEAGDTLGGARFVKDNTDAIKEQILAYRLQSETLGMTLRAADKYRTAQQLINDAERQGITIDDDLRKKIDALADSYATASDNAREFERSQKAAADAAGLLSHSAYDALEGVLFEGKSVRAALHDLTKDIGEAVLRSELLGEGPLAGIFGTDKQKTVGGSNGGLLSQLFGKAFGVGKPTGTATDPLWVQIAGAAGLGAGGGGGLLGGLAKALGFKSDIFGGGGLSFGDPGTVGFGGADLTSMVGLFHGGSRDISAPSQYRPVDPRVFMAAPRLHSGLGPDEFPAILERGEEVKARRGRGGHQGQAPQRPVVMHVHGVQDPGHFMRSERQITGRLRRRLGPTE